MLDGGEPFHAVFVDFALLLRRGEAFEEVHRLPERGGLLQLLRHAVGVVHSGELEEVDPSAERGAERVGEILVVLAQLDEVKILATTPFRPEKAVQ